MTTFAGGWNEDGFHLSFDLDEFCEEPETDGPVHMRLDGNQVVELVEFLRSEGALDYASEYARERTAYERATPAERARVLHLDREDNTETGYALDDPKHPTYYERMVDR